MASRYEPVIGLEVHAQLLTNSKIFCGCSTRVGREPNENTCPICTGMPGVLPVLNRRAVEYAVKMGLAVECRINPRSIFARKNYFYPDLPKGYQISQYEQPLAEHGALEIDTGSGRKRIGITRIHMEEDAGKNIHSPTEKVSFVDLNRTGVPLIEIVSDPDMRSAEEAVAYLKALRAILVYLGICDGNMEEGSFRCDANVSIRPRGAERFGTRAELKNLNSFRHVQKAIEFEIARQEDVLEDGEEVVQETRLFDVAQGVTRSMRGKEEAHDYRYFPDPDLLPVVLDDAFIARVRAEMPELPDARRRRFVEDYGLSAYEAEVLTASRELADYFEAAADASGGERRLAATWVMGELLGALNRDGLSLSASPVDPAMLGGLIRRIADQTISGKIAKQVFDAMWQGAGDADRIIEERGLRQITDSSALEAVVARIVAAHPGQAAEYRSGKDKLFGFFVGQVMRETQGKANPAQVNELLRRELDQ